MEKRGTVVGRRRVHQLRQSPEELDPPLSWLIERDVDAGRKILNFSEWERPQKGAQKLARAVRKGEMPPWYYAAFRSRAHLSRAEVQMLIQGLEATFPGQH